MAGPVSLTAPGVIAAVVKLLIQTSLLSRVGKLLEQEAGHQRRFCLLPLVTATIKNQGGYRLARWLVTGPLLEFNYYARHERNFAMTCPFRRNRETSPTRSRDKRKDIRKSITLQWPLEGVF